MLKVRLMWSIRIFFVLIIVNIFWDIQYPIDKLNCFLLHRLLQRREEETKILARREGEGEEGGRVHTEIDFNDSAPDQ